MSNARRNFRWMGILIAASGILLTIATAHQVIAETTGIGADAVKLAIWPAILFVALTVILLILQIPKWYKKFKRDCDEAFASLRDRVLRDLPFDVRPCTFADALLLDALSTEQFGSNSSNHAEILDLMQTDPNVFCKIVPLTETTGRAAIRGYFAIMRLSREGENAIKDGSFSGRAPKRTHIRTDKKRYTNVYIAAIYGRSAKERGFALAALISHLNSIKARKIYARAATKHGLRLLRKYDFKPIDTHPDKVGSVFSRMYAPDGPLATARSA